MTAPQAPGPPPAPFIPPQPVNPRPSSRNGCVTALAVVGAVVLVLVVAGTVIGLVAGARSTVGPATSTTVPVPAGNSGGGASGPLGQSRTNPAPVGTPVTPAKDWTVRVTSAELNGDATMRAENVFVSPNSGKQFVIVGLEVTNGSNQAGATVGNVKFKLLSPSGVATEASWDRPPNHFEISSQLQPGATLSGYLAFEVPSADVTGSLLLAEPVFTMTPQDDQRLLALG